MAILNLTPDSFSDGGKLTTPDAARDAAARAVAEGADMLDLGAESTRPGAARVAAEEQIRRLVSSLRAIRAALPNVPISIDTTLAAVARAALDAGADAVNDVSACLEDPSMLPLAAERRAGLILMHRLRPPGEDSYSDRYADAPRYADVTEEVSAFLASRAHAAVAAGVQRDAVVLDPGLGFGKSVEQNLLLLRETPRLLQLNYPILSALSRKSFVGRVALQRESDPGERVAATIALSVAHYLAGARVFRVHDVAPHVQALRAISALRSPNMPQTD
jgi:dihydropteroate synthase